MVAISVGIYWNSTTFCLAELPLLNVSWAARGNGKTARFNSSDALGSQPIPRAAHAVTRQHECMTQDSLTRRTFLKAAALAGTAVVLGDIRLRQDLRAEPALAAPPTWV